MSRIGKIYYCPKFSVIIYAIGKNTWTPFKRWNCEIGYDIFILNEEMFKSFEYIGEL